MQEEIIVEAGPDVLRSVSRCDAINAIEELIWNSLDADANTVEITYQYNELESLNWIRIVDDGSGFEVSPKEAFGSFGNSLKRLRDRTPSGRIQHGREGRGRYKALALGSSATWTSIANHLGETYLKTIITVQKANPNRFIPVETQLKAPQSTGMDVLIEAPTDEAAALFQSDFQDEIALRFAPYLRAYPHVLIKVNGQPIDPMSSLIDYIEQEVTVTSNGVPCDATILLCIWKKTTSEGQPLSRIFFCTRDGFAIEDHPGYVRRLGISMTAYVHSAYFSVENTPGTYTRMIEMDEVAKGFLSNARELMRLTNRKRLYAQAKDEVAKLKLEDIYPFKGEAQSEAEQVEREVFDIVAEQLHVLKPDIALERLSDRKKKMVALREVLTSEGSIQSFLIDQVLELKPEQQKDFYDVLQMIPLSSVVGLSKTVIDRLHFISGLKMILFEPEIKKMLKERSQLHRILAEHIWLFGEEYHLGADDISLKNVLLRHRDILELDEGAFELDQQVAQTLSDVPDLMLYKLNCYRPGYYEHVVIELKAPRVVCGEREFSQINRYARTVADCDDFDKEKTKWTFILVNNAFDEAYYRQVACQSNRPEGLVIQQDNYQTYAYKWSKIIQAAEGRHEFLRDRLNYQISGDGPGLQYLRDKFSNYLPGSLLDTDENVAKEIALIQTQDKEHALPKGED